MSTLKIAIQKSGRLNEDSLKLLKDCGIKIDNGKDQLKVAARNFPIEVLYLRNSDIPQYIEDGVVDIAIIGENILIEKQKESEIVEKLGFAKCRVSLAVPKRIESNEVSYFKDKKIATSYPNTLNAYLKENNIEADIHVISGSVEIAPNIGLADGVCDIVSSGSTLFKNGLRETQVILKSEAVLAKNINLDAEKEAILTKLIFRIQAVLRAKNTRYVLMNVPNDKIDEVAAILPVLKSPTILPLAQEGWSSLHSVIDEDKFWNNIDALKNAGAEGILVVPIDKMVL
ncbi:ATP phosphoribosyltransferase [Lacinutrix sp. C3R15]|uniref:ATP phosphoribosyltransferase n=1 Tax=Flavobacteriaceae TaxID=49546 RepID=UPI001C099190|nr:MULTISPECIES: ATP phosphoribosyltransferase [Flavobacteriaceae]MBU2939960.1 ATP phosphoribosyltransferase [Lacinutrix sp. C3R15]MDO6623277.1 ATP phosphoribosyltransferase [Oceanihabitans sp. 1_MG-2023]